MEQENIAIYHLILDEAKTNIDGLIKELEKFPDVQLWMWEANTIRVGRLPKIFKVIPVDKLAYQDGWLVIKLNETSFLRHLYIVCEAKDRYAVAELLKNALAALPGLRMKVEREAYEL
jgi:hypothetical protein